MESIEFLKGLQQKYKRGMTVSEMNDFRDYVEEQQHLCYGVELGGTPAVVGSLARQYDFLLETIDTYQEINQPHLNENQLIVLKWLKDKYTITDIEPIELFWRLHVNTKNKFRTLLAYRAYKSLTRKAQLEVLQVFSQWALEQEEE